MLADWLENLLVALEVLLVHLEMRALVLESMEGGIFDTQHNHVGGGHILVTAAHSLNIVGLDWWLVANCVLCWMESAEKTAEHLDIVAVRAGNNTHAADISNWFVSQIHWRGKCQVMNYFPMIPNCFYRIVACLISNMEEPCWLNSVEFLLLTCYVNNDDTKLWFMWEVRYIESEYGWVYCREQWSQVEWRSFYVPFWCHYMWCFTPPSIYQTNSAEK